MPHRVSRRVTALAAVAALVLPGCSGGEGRAGGGAGGPVPLTHVHGLGVNPADGAVYVATHHGLYRIGADGTPVAVGERRQDTMGFTVAGPDRFLASGHPAPGEGDAGPPLLGLIGSDDAGRTWRPLSLAGEADFHTLVAAHGRVYGWNSATAQVMVSADGGATWDRRAALPLVSFAVDPADPDHLVGSGRDGLLVSRDGGRTWRPAPGGGPGPALLAWDRAGGLWAAALDGAVSASADGGRTWERRGALPGDAAALLATPDGVYAATAGAHVVLSRDGGRTWTPVYEPPAGAAGH